MWHYDIRLRCPVTGQLEATEDMGMSFESAMRVLEFYAEEPSRYERVLVSCDEPASAGVHNVDVAYHVHQTVHEGHADWEYLGYVGTPQDHWFVAPGLAPASI